MTDSAAGRKVLLESITIHRHENNDSMQVRFSVDGKVHGLGFSTNIFGAEYDRLDPLPDLGLRTILLRAMKALREHESKVWDRVIEEVEAEDTSSR